MKIKVKDLLEGKEVNIENLEEFKEVPQILNESEVQEALAKKAQGYLGKPLDGTFSKG